MDEKVSSCKGDNNNNNNKNIKNQILSILKCFFIKTNNDNNVALTLKENIKPLLLTANQQNSLYCNINNINFETINNYLDEIFKNNKTDIQNFNEDFIGDNLRKCIFLDKNRRRIVYKAGDQIALIEKDKITIIPQYCMQTQREIEDDPVVNRAQQIIDSYNDENGLLNLENYIAFEIYYNQNNKTISSKLIFHKEKDDDCKEIVIKKKEKNEETKKFEYKIENTGHEILLVFQDSDLNSSNKKNNYLSLEITNDNNNIEPKIVASNNTEANEKEKYSTILKNLTIELIPIINQQDQDLITTDKKEDNNCCDLSIESLKDCCNSAKTSLSNLINSIKSKLFG